MACLPACNGAATAAFWYDWDADAWSRRGAIAFPDLMRVAIGPECVSVLQVKGKEKGVPAFRVLDYTGA